MALTLTKTTNKVNVFPGNTITYTVVIRNTGAVEETNINFTDLTPIGATFVPGSFTIGGVAQPTANPNVGVTIPNIAAAGSTTVTYQVTANAQPAPTSFTNTATANSTPTGGTVAVTYTSNSVTVNVAVLEFFKSADKAKVSINEEITYTLIISNTGAVTATTPTLTDVLPACLQFVTGSFSENGIPNLQANPTTGVILTDIPAGRTTTVSFRVKVTCIPCPPRFINKASLNFGIDSTGQGDIVFTTITSNEVLTAAAISTFKQLSREEYVTIPCQKPDAEEILNTLVDVVITDYKVIKTPIAKSLEGQNLTGYKVIVEGALNQKVEYIADEPEQSVHAAHFRYPFSTFIILPATFVEGTPIELEGIVEDIYTLLIDKRTVFKNITFMITAKSII